MNFEELCKEVKASKNGKRFYTSIDMASIKKMQAVRNARIKRKQKVIRYRGIEQIMPCGCGTEGCFLV
jgi:hypothetical protein